MKPSLRVIACLMAATVLSSSVPCSGWARSKSERPAPSEMRREEESARWERRSDRAEQWFFSDLPRHLGNDFKYTFWNGWHLLFLAAGAGATAAVHEADSSIQKAFQPGRPLGGTLDKTLDIGFHPLTLAGASVLALGVAKLNNADQAALTAGTMLEALLITQTLTLGLKYATGRQRPDGTRRSFPSGHASGAFALATVAQVFHGPWAGIPSYAVASLVGLSRIDANKHFASDVLAGAVLGTLIGLGTAKFHKKEFSHFFLVPTANNDSAGLILVRLF